MTAVLDKIRGNLETHLNATTPTLPLLAWDNVRTNQKTLSAGADPYISVKFAPVQRRAAVQGPDPEYRYTGVLLLTICIPEYTGIGAALTLADRLMDRFVVDTSITGVDVDVSIAYSEAEVGFHRSPFYCLPVRVGWYAYA